MIVHLRSSDALKAMPADDPNHSGVFSSPFSKVFESAGEAVQVGFEELTDDVTAAPADGFEEIVVILEGTAEIECSCETYRIEPGEVIVQDHQIGTKRLRTPGLKTAYVIRQR